MKTDKLIPMVDFVLKQNENRKQNIDIPEQAKDENERFARVVLNYARFLSQQLKLEMFVGEDKLFYDLEVKRISIYSYQIMMNGNIIWFSSNREFTIETLMSFGDRIPLTPIALKQIYG